MQNFAEYLVPNSIVQLALSVMSEVLMIRVTRMTRMNKYLTDYLSVHGCISFIVNEKVRLVFHRDLVVNLHEQRFRLVKNPLRHDTDLSPVSWAS